MIGLVTREPRQTELERPAPTARSSWREGVTGEVTAGVDPRSVPHESQAKMCERDTLSDQCSQ